MFLDILKIIAVAAVLAYVGLLIMALWMAPRLIFPFPAPSYEDGPGSLRIAFAPNRSVRALYLENPEATRLLFFHHGNAEDLGHLQESLESYRQRGYAVLAYDYPGYGTSDGFPSARSLSDSARAVLDHAHDTLGWSYETIIAYGRSLGGGPALVLASEYPLAGVILEATFTSTYRVVTRWQLLPWDIFDNLVRIRRVQCPVLILHGRKDRTVPFHHAEQLLAAAPAGTADHLWIDGADHVNLVEEAGESYWSKLDAFAHRRPRSHTIIP